MLKIELCWRNSSLSISEPINVFHSVQVYQIRWNDLLSQSFQEIKATTNSPRSMAEENLFVEINLRKRRRVFLPKAERISQRICKLVK